MSSPSSKYQANLNKKRIAVGQCSRSTLTGRRLSRAPNKTFPLTISYTNDSNHANLILTKPAISKIGNQNQCFDSALHSSLWDLPYSFEETTSVTALAYGLLIYWDWNGERTCLLKWFLTNYCRHIRDLIVKLSQLPRIHQKKAAAFLYPLLAVLEIITDLVKISFITKQNTVFTQTSHRVRVNLIAVRKHKPGSSLVHPY